MLFILEGSRQESQHPEIVLSRWPPAVLSAILAATLEESHSRGREWGHGMAAQPPQPGLLRNPSVFWFQQCHPTRTESKMGGTRSAGSV